MHGSKINISKYALAFMQLFISSYSYVYMEQLYHLYMPGSQKQACNASMECLAKILCTLIEHSLCTSVLVYSVQSSFYLYK